MATLQHYCSTDKTSTHEDYPAIADSWCEWHRAKATGSLKSFTYPPRAITPDIEKHLTIYQSLSRDDLLMRCLGGHTQNAN